MPFIVPTESITPIAIATRFRTTTVNADLNAGLGATAARNRSATVNGSVLTADAIDAVRARAMSVFGFLLGEPNVFGSATAVRARAADVVGSIRYEGKAIAVRNRTAAVAARVELAESSTLNILLTIGEFGSAGFGNTYSARIVADGETYLIKSFNYTEDRGDVGVGLQVTLLDPRPANREAIEAANEFTFDVYDGTDWITLFDSGKRTGIGFNFTFTDGRPADGLQLSTNGDVDNKLRKSPESNETVFDNTRLTVTAADFSVIYDTDGNAFIQTITPIPGLDLYALLNYVLVNQCGFAGYQTTIPNFPIRRADAGITGTWFDAIAGHIGAFSPLIFVVDDIVWLIDSTAPFPAGFGSSEPLPASEYQNASFEQSELEIDGYIVQFADSETDFDYVINRFVDDAAEPVGTFGSPDYTETVVRRTYADYFKNSNPTVPVRTEKTRERRETSGFVGPTFITIATETEELNYDSFGRLMTINKTTTARIPDLTAVGFPSSEQTTKIERTQFLYGPDRLNPLRQILRKTIKEVSGLITIDNDNPHLEKPFRQEFGEGFAAGNLSDTLAQDFVSISQLTETVEQNEKGQIEIRTRSVNFLVDPPQITQSTTDARAGDMSTNAQTGGTKEVVVFRQGSTRTNARMSTLAVAELPVEQATALARRKLSRRQNRRGTVTLKGLKLSVGRGTMFELFDRDGITAGNFVVEGRSISANNLGSQTQATRQVLEVTKI